MNFQSFLPFFSLLFFWVLTSAQSNHFPISFKPPSHPRLLWLKGEERAMQHDVATDSLKQKVHRAILQRADAIIAMTPIERIIEGRRLLNKSREFLNRMFYLGYAYRMTLSMKYADRGVQEMLAVAAFSDWNPAHFLDVAEMTTGMAIGYDWLYDAIPTASKNTLEQAIINFGLNASLDKKNNNWLKVNNNWNQVCNTGMAFGAFGVYETNPSLANAIINRSIESIKIPMQEYAPNGAYPEGYGYWNYGTSFNVLFLSALEKLVGDDFNLSKAKGFLATSSYMLYMTGANGACFNYSDCAPSKYEVSAAMFWFAKKEKNNGLLYHQIQFLQRSNPKSLGNDRLLPCLLVWASGNSFSNVSPPKSNIWVGQGKTPVALLHSSWVDSTMIFVGLKAGSPSTNHAHLDIGSFVMDAMGERWAMDLGMENYYHLEQAGLDIWNEKQQSQRWGVFRYNNFAHNTLSINDSLQRVIGNATITSYSNAPDSLAATTDITALYQPGVQSAIRTVAIINKSKVTVTDAIKNNHQPSRIRWTMVTPAEVQIIDAKTIALQQHNKMLYLHLKYKGTASPFIMPAKPSTQYENENKGIQLVGFDFNLQPNEVAKWVITFDGEK